MSASSAWTPLPVCSDVESRGRGWLLENMQLLGLDAEDLDEVDAREVH